MELMAATGVTDISLHLEIGSRQMTGMLARAAATGEPEGTETPVDMEDVVEMGDEATELSNWAYSSQ